jgi:hypothetical protein
MHCCGEKWTKTMPIIAVDVNEDLYDRMVDLVSKRKYRDLSQLLDVAIRNHLALEDRLSSEGLRHITLEAQSANTRKPTAGKSQRSRSQVTAPNKVSSAGSGGSDVEWNRVTTKFRFETEEQKGPPTCEAIVRPSDEQMYSLVNRLFPIKLVARWLDVQATVTGHWPLFEDASTLVGKDAALVGSLLASADALMQRSRDDCFATALPRLDKPESEDRFCTQFIGRLMQTSSVYPGAIIQFALAESKNGQLVLTNKGRALSRLPNPVIDETGALSTMLLTEDERSLFVDQVRSFMPREAADFKVILEAVQTGFNTPSDLLQHLEGKFGGRETPAAFRSHISGVISRLIESGLLHRIWKGRYVSYDLNDNSLAFLHSLPSSEVVTSAIH